jgi:NAD(P)-dependent dehydrogenase (short-subunit alcohol dehydrogenase family)
MVALKVITENNISLLTTIPNPTAVFVGATNGIGLSTLKALLNHTASPTIYIVGRSQEKLRTLITTQLKPLNKNATFHSIVAEDLTLVSDAEKAAQQILSSPKINKIDLLIMSPGFIDFARQISPEGIDRLTSIRFYSRFRILTTLLPLLRSAPSSRVVSVLAGGQEGQLWPEDWTMEKHWGVANAGGASSSLTTLMFEELAGRDENRNVEFVHLFPGLVRDTGLKFEGAGVIGGFLLSWIVLPIVLRLMGYSVQEAGERVLYAATSKRVGRKGDAKGSDGVVGSGVNLVGGDSEILEMPAVAKKMREDDDMVRKVYEHTMEVFKRVDEM